MIKFVSVDGDDDSDGDNADSKKSQGLVREAGKSWSSARQTINPFDEENNASVYSLKHNFRNNLGKDFSQER